MFSRVHVHVSGGLHVIEYMYMYLVAYMSWDVNVQ